MMIICYIFSYLVKILESWTFLLQYITLHFGYDMFGIHVFASRWKMRCDFQDEHFPLAGHCDIKCFLYHIVAILIFHQWQHIATYITYLKN